jgi:hypothetical protein
MKNEKSDNLEAKKMNNDDNKRITKVVHNSTQYDLILSDNVTKSKSIWQIIANKITNISLLK